MRRSSLRPRKSLLRNCASSRDSTSVIVTTTTTHTTVLPRIRGIGTVGKVSAPAGPMKLSKPAGPRSTPYALYFRVAVYAMRIVG